ncbi:MAG: hypothetical protein RLZZ127_2387 [Planctomycetota bacterium]|jgi:hypothetical protein
MMTPDPDLRRRGGPSPTLRARILAAARARPWWEPLAVAAAVLLLLSALIGPEPIPQPHPSHPANITDLLQEP